MSVSIAEAKSELNAAIGMLSQSGGPGEIGESLSRQDRAWLLSHISSALSCLEAIESVCAGQEVSS